MEVFTSFLNASGIDVRNATRPDDSVSGYSDIRYNPWIFVYIFFYHVLVFYIHTKQLDSGATISNEDPVPRDFCVLRKSMKSLERPLLKTISSATLPSIVPDEQDSTTDEIRPSQNIANKLATFTYPFPISNKYRSQWEYDGRELDKNGRKLS